MLTVDLEVPTSIRLKLNGDKVKKKAGQKVATLIRGRIRKGIDGDGSALPVPSDGGKPLMDSRKMVNSIKYRKLNARRGTKAKIDVVAPSTSRRPGITGDANSNFGIMSIQIATNPELKDPMGQESAAQQAVLSETATKEIARQMRTKEGGLKVELRKTLRSAQGGRRRRRRR